MLTRRIIPCLDVRNKIVTKGVKFKNNVDLGEPVEMAQRYSDEGCDELVFYDITASAEGRPIDIVMVEEVARAIRIPFVVREISSMASICANIWTSLGSPALTKGSPPVTLTLFIPNSAAASATA